MGNTRECNIMVPVFGTSNCRPRRKDEFDEASFRNVRSGKAIIVVGCPKGHYDPSAGKCRKGTRAYKMIVNGKDKKRG